MYNIARGLSGKARREHARSRASRFYADQLVADYLEEEEAPMHALVPIRRKNEFLPTAAVSVSTDDPDDSGVGMQLELPLAGAMDLGGGRAEASIMETSKPEIASTLDECNRNEGASISCGGRDDAAEDSLDAESFPESSDDKSAALTTGPVRRRALGLKTMSAPPIGWVPGKVVEAPAPEFSFSGFAYGCALGGAAAAAALVVFQIVLG